MKRSTVMLAVDDLYRRAQREGILLDSVQVQLEGRHDVVAIGLGTRWPDAQPRELYMKTPLARLEDAVLAHPDLLP